MGNCRSLITYHEDKDQEWGGWPSYKNLRAYYLNEIVKTQALDKRLEQENNVILNDFLKDFLRSLVITDEMFKIMYKRFYFTGSYYNNMRIGTPDEFDWNLVLELPFTPESIKVECKKGAASYAKLRVWNLDYENEYLPEKFFENNCLIPEEIRRWFQGAVDKALRICPIPYNCTAVKVKQSGPARTIVITKRGNTKISVDIVPVFECRLTGRIQYINNRIYRKMRHPIKCFLIPKPYDPPGEYVSVDPHEARKLWMLHFPEEEKRVITDLGCAKSVVKLLKMLRDKYGWKILASYHLETVVMWLLFENSQVEESTEDEIYEMFLEALEKLLKFIQQRKIPYYFSSPHNLISKISDDEALEISDTLRTIISNIEEDPRDLPELFE